jgi:transcriptional regulator with XRE-family HTH domain
MSLSQNSRGIKKSYNCNGDLLRYHRNRKSWTQCELARVSGYTERLISKAEAGNRVSTTTIEDLAQALSCSEVKLGLYDLVCDPIASAREYIHALYTHKQDFISKIENLLHEDVVFYICGEESGLPFAGTHRGIEEISKAFEIFFSVLEVPAGHDYRPHYKFFGRGNEVMIWGNTWIHPIGAPIEQPMPISNLLTFEGGKIIEFNDRFDVELGKKLLMSG